MTADGITGTEKRHADGRQFFMSGRKPANCLYIHLLSINRKNGGMGLCTEADLGKMEATGPVLRFAYLTLKDSAPWRKLDNITCNEIRLYTSAG